jgi:hypothetical protein
MVFGFGGFASRLSRWVRNAAPLVALSASLMCAGALGVAHADDIPPPRAMMVDANGVDLLSGDVSFSATFNSIGPKGAGITSTRTFRGVGPDIDSLDSYVLIENEPTDTLPVDDNKPQRTTLVLGGRSMQFYGAAGQDATAPIDDAQGSFNTGANATTGIIYTATDGTQAIFAYVTHPPRQVRPAVGRLQKLILPTGEILTFSYASPVRRIESSLGYVLRGSYSVQNVPNGASSIAANLAEGQCDETTCAGTQYSGEDTRARMPTEAYPNGTSGTSYPYTITTPNGVVTTYTLSSTPWNFRVSSVQRAGQTWTYTYSVVQDSSGDQPFDGILTTTVTAPNGVKRIVISRLGTAHVISDEEGVVGTAAGRKTLYGYSDDGPAGSTNLKGFGKLTKVTTPDGDSYLRRPIRRSSI